MRLSFRVTLFALMLAVLLTAVTLLATAAYLYARFSSEDLGKQILVQEAERLDQHVQQVLDVAEAEAETAGMLLADEWIDSGDHERLSEYFLASLRARPSLSYLSFGGPDGKYCHSFRDREGSLSILWLLPKGDGTRRLVEFAVGQDGRRETVRDIADSVRTPPYERPYYRAAQEAGQSIWTESYVFLGSGESLDVPGVSRAVPVARRENGELLGVLTADFDLHAMSRYLRQVAVGVEGLAFVVEVSGEGQPRVIGHPAAAHPNLSRRLDLTEPAPDGDGRVTVLAANVPDRRVTEMISWLGNDLSGISRELHPISFELGERSYTGGYRHLGREGGPNWILCMVIPEDEIFGGVHRMAQLMVLLGLGGVVLGGVLSVLLSRRVSSSLTSIAEETREIGAFRLEAKEPVHSRIREISTLAGAVEEMKTGLRSFQKYVPADLVRTLLESGQEAALGGARKEITVHFSDIVGFTSLSEQLAPDTLVDLLSQYLDEMTGEILRSGGTVDKYIGDAIMAFWGALQVKEDHALAACRTALANQARLAELRDEWRRHGLPELRARIGLHTGLATVGNFGSPSRLDYTAIGDTVNIASRLEGLNRIYGTAILISDATRAAAGDAMVVRPIDEVAVKGREGSLRIYELIGETGKVTEQTIGEVECFAEALVRYFAGDWAAALAGFEAVLKLAPDDGAALLMRKRCTVFQESPPGSDWDGVFRAPK